MDQLDTEYESHNANYESQYAHLTSEQLDDMDIQTGFDEFKPFRDFEARFAGFISKRSQIESVENTWLENNLTGIDPDDMDYTFDEAENTLFDGNYQLKVGNATYQMTADGLVEASGGINISSLGMMADGCVTNKRSTKKFPEGDTDRKYKLKVAIHSILIRSSVKGKVVSFKKKSNGGYKRSSMDLAISIAGTLYEADCIGTQPLSLRNPTSGFKKRKSIKVRKGDAGITYRTKYGELGARFDTPNEYASVILY